MNSQSMHRRRSDLTLTRHRNPLPTYCMPALPALERGSVALTAFALVCLLLLVPKNAAAQRSDSTSTNGRSMSFQPSVVVTSGLDTNVFNEAEAPKRDAVITWSPRLDGAIRVGPAAISGRGRLDIVRFQQFESERSVDTDDAVRLDLLFNRVRPFVAARFLHSRQRPRFEIDARARRIERVFTAGAQVGLTGKSSIELSATESRRQFDADAVFLGTSLADSLNRRIDTVAAGLHVAVTPLTKIVVDVAHDRERFATASFRDLDTLRIEPGVRFSPGTMLSGRASVGYRRSIVVQPGLRDFSGPVAAVDLQYRIRQGTRFTVSADRDLGQSYRLDLPHYDLTGIGGGFIQDLWGKWNVRGQVLRDRYEYRATGSTAVGVAPEAPVETMRTVALVLGYRTPRGAGIDFTADHYQRRSTFSLRRRIDGLRAGCSVTYGF